MIKVFTDGSCSNNGFSNARAGIGIYFGDNDPRNISRKIDGKQTNNIAELSAIIDVFDVCKSDIENGKKIMIYSDSEYSIHCCGEYGKKCNKMNWKNKKGFIANHELVKKVYELFKNNSNVEIHHIKAHTGLTDELSLGNEGADKLANEAIGLKSCPYDNYKHSNKIYFNISYDNKEIAKKHGAKWNPTKKKWYYEGNHDDDNFKKLIDLFPY